MTHIPPYADATAYAHRTPVHSRAFVQLHSGFCVDLMAPDFTALTLTDLATGLSRLPRFNGATRGRPYSVAQHSILVADILKGQRHNLHTLRAGLLHDAHEAVMGDIATPVKAALGREAVHQVETRLAIALFVRFGLGPLLVHHWAIHDADQIALQTERRDLLTRSAWPWPEAQHEPIPNLIIEPWPESLAHTRFLIAAARLGLR